MGLWDSVSYNGVTQCYPAQRGQAVVPGSSPYKVHEKWIQARAHPLTKSTLICMLLYPLYVEHSVRTVVVTKGKMICFVHYTRQHFFQIYVSCSKLFRCPPGKIFKRSRFITILCEQPHDVKNVKQ